MCDAPKDERKSSLEKKLVSTTNEARLPQDLDKLNLYNLSDFGNAGKSAAAPVEAGTATKYCSESLFDAISVDIPTTFADQRYALSPHATHTLLEF